MNRTVAALIGFVAGAWLLQQQADLPPGSMRWALGVGGAAVLLLAFLIGRRAQAAAAALLAGPRLSARRGTEAADTPLGTSAAMSSSAAAILGISVILAFVAGGMLGFTHAAWMAQVRLADELRFEDEGQDVRVIGTVASLPAHLQRGTRFEFNVEEVRTPALHVPARLALAWFDEDARVRPAQRWEFTVRLRRPHGNLNPGGFDLEAWLLERGVRATGYVRANKAEPARKIEDFVAVPLLVVDRARDGLRDALAARLQSYRYGGVLIALVLGDQRAIREDDWLLFNRTGISHLVSISGLHITMIAGLGALLAGWAWRRSPRLLAWGAAQSAAALAAVVTALAYCLLAGWGVPAQRTFLMLATVAVALWQRLGTRPATTLAMAAFLVCLLDPWAVRAPGFWLSFGAVAAIFLTAGGRRPAPAHSRFGAIRGKLAAAARVQLAVTTALIPLTIALFQQVSVVSPLANALAIPVVSLAVTPLALVAAAFAALPEPLGAFAVPLLAVAHGLFSALAQALEAAVAWPGATVTLAAPPLWAVFLGVAGAAWLLAPRGWPWRWAGAIWLLPLFAWPLLRPASDEIWVTALDVGQGMAVLVETRSHALLYDTGPRFTAADAGGRIIAPYLRYRGIDRLDWLVVSHLDSDHSGGAESILSQLRVERVLTSIDPAHRSLRGAAHIERCLDGQAFALGDLRLQVLHPEAPDYARRERSTNARSCVLALHWGRQRVLLTGDLPAVDEERLLARRPDQAATLISAPHHGSRHSSSPAFLAATRPRWALVQAGYRNRFGHPDPGVVARYRAQRTEVARTDQLGSLQWRLHRDGGGRFVATRHQEARYWHNRPAAELPLPDADDGDPALPATGAADSRLPLNAPTEMMTPDQP
ncbi:MAG TPA: DNA internalization-related competence protein ComEC/Rec2 [Burkholderiaceae bacterium]|nr:DNA internalization-related competence protein ComEC/Rec2 [Burkholderiaceae bacterium]